MLATAFFLPVVIPITFLFMFASLLYYRVYHMNGKRPDDTKATESCKHVAGPELPDVGSSETTRYAWNRVFAAYNAARMKATETWYPPAKGRIEKAMKLVLDGSASTNDETDNEPPEKEYKRYLDAVNRLAAYVFSASRTRKRSTDHDGQRDSVTDRCVLILTAAVDTITSRRQPVDYAHHRNNPYDWFIYTGRVTEALINAHCALCANGIAAADGAARPDDEYVPATGRQTSITVATELTALCTSFCTSLGVRRESSNAVCVASAFLYGSCLLAAVDTGRSSPADFLATLVANPANQYALLRRNVARRIGRCADDGAGDTDFDLDGVYLDRSFFAHRAVRMYSYIRPFCEQLFSIDALLAAAGDAVHTPFATPTAVRALVRACETMGERGRMYYFTLHSRSGGYKFRTGADALAYFGADRFAPDPVGVEDDRGNVYAADSAKSLFCNCAAFTFHALGQTKGIAIGEVDRFNRGVNIVHAFAMAQRPLFASVASERPIDTEVPGPFELEPCVVDSRPHFGYVSAPRPAGTAYDFGLDKSRNTTFFTAERASSALASMPRLGVLATELTDSRLGVTYTRFTVAGPSFVLTAYTRLGRVGPGEGPLRLSAYTGRLEAGADLAGRSVPTLPPAARFYGFDDCGLVVCHGLDGLDATVRVIVERNVPVRNKAAGAALDNVSVLMDGGILSYGSPVVMVWLPRRDTLPTSDGDLYYSTGRMIELRSLVCVNEDADDASSAEGATDDGALYSTPCGAYRVYVDSRVVAICEPRRRLLCVSDYGDGAVDDTRRLVADMRRLVLSSKSTFGPGPGDSNGGYVVPRTTLLDHLMNGGGRTSDYSLEPIRMTGRRLYALVR